MPENNIWSLFLAEIEAENERKRRAVANALRFPILPPAGNSLTPLRPAARFGNTFSNPLLGPLSPPSRVNTLSSFDSLFGDLASLPTTKRKVFYSFHYDDIIRVNNVRHTEQFKAKILEVPQSHYDRSLWETSKRTSPKALKELIRDGVKDTSVVCVLIGSQTWSRPWVRYEIARSVIDGKGLLGVDLNSINHHEDRGPHPLGPNPLAYMAVGKMSDGTYRLYEKNGRVLPGQVIWTWELYGDYALAVTLPKYLASPDVGYVMPLSSGAFRYDARRDDVWKNMSTWLNLAAVRAGRK